VNRRVEGQPRRVYLLYMSPVARCVAALMTIGLLGCSSVGNDCFDDCAAGGSAGAASGAGGQGTGGAGGRPLDDGNFCGTLSRPLVSEEDPPCTFDIGPLPSDDGRTSYDTITISADGERLVRDPNHESGWDYVDASKMSIAVYGPACQDLASGAIEELSVSFLCLLF
jgi:hypothetical protein